MLPWQSRPAPPLRAAIVVPAWLSHAVLIPIYWNQAWIVRLPLPISPCVNASAPPFGGSGLSFGSLPGGIVIGTHATTTITIVDNDS